MGTITLQGSAIEIAGELPKAGEKAPDFVLVKNDLSETGLNDFSGKTVVLNIFPSVDTPVCATSVRRFNEDAGKKADTVVLCISADLPFAHSRFCGAEGLENVVSLSTFRDHSFGKNYGVVMTNGPLAGLMSRAVVVIAPDGTVKYSEQIPEIAQDPDYEAALAAL